MSNHFQNNETEFSDILKTQTELQTLYLNSLLRDSINVSDTNMILVPTQY